jgi:hypothetical protein
LIVENNWFYETDGSRHDAHMHRGFFELKWSLYQRVFSTIPRDVLRYAKELARRTVAISRVGVAYAHDYRVRSGDPDTKDGNSVCTDFVAFVITDLVTDLTDEVGAESRKSLIETQILSLGYEVKTHVTRDPYDVTFLSGAFCTVDGDWYWYPLIGRQLAKLGWTIRQVGEKHTWRDFAGNLHSFRAFSYVPFLRHYVAVVSQLIPSKYRITPPVKRYQVTGQDCPREPTADTWDAIYARYGLGPEDEQQFLSELQAVNTLPFMIDSPIYRILLARDMA